MCTTRFSLKKINLLWYDGRPPVDCITTRNSLIYSVMKVVTTEQMRALDQRTIAAGTPVVELMERAGRAVAQVALKLLHNRASPAILLFAGKGNNGGDTFVVARELAAAGCRPTLVLLGQPGDLTGAARSHFQKLTGIPIIEWPGNLPPSDLIVDGLLGTGRTGEVRGPYATAIRFINSTNVLVLSIDVPSGLGTPTCVCADVTVTFGVPKLELLQPAAADFIGQLEVVDIGLLAATAAVDGVEWLTEADIVLPKRKRSAHKGTFGHLLIIAGAEGYTGAPVLCAHAAARSGVGLVTLAVPRAIYPIIAGRCPPEVMPIALDRLPAMDNFAAVAIGPGLGREPETQSFVRDLVAKITGPVVVDADALAAIRLRPGLILTPHPGEMGRLIGQSASAVQANRWEIARQFARDQDVTLALKGAGTVVTDKSGKLWINSTGNPGMAKGGMGDALTGLIGALLAQGLPAIDAVKAGVFLHGRAGDLAAQRIGEPAMLASDLIASLGAAFSNGPNTPASNR